MSGGGFILGGLLSGIGQGMSQDIADRRQIALQNARAQAQAASDERQAAMQEDKDNRLAEREEAKDIRADKRARGLLELGGKIDVLKDENRTKGNLREIDAKGKIEMKVTGMKIAGDKAITALKGQLDRTNDAASQRLRAELEGDNVDSVQQTTTGQFFIINKDGSTKTTAFKGALKSEEGSTDTPLSRSGAPKPAAAPARTAPQASTPAAAKATGRPVLSKSEYQNAINGAIRKANAGEPGWPKDQAGIKKKLQDIYGAAGYDLPSI